EFLTADLATGKLSKLKVDGFDWPLHVTRAATPFLGSGRIALLVRQSNLVASEHKLAVFGGTENGRVLNVPAGLRLNDYSSVYWTPGGEGMAVVDGRSPKIWITSAKPNAGAKPEAKDF